MKKSDLETAPDRRSRSTLVERRVRTATGHRPRPPAATMYRSWSTRKARRFGMTRRQFAESASGMVGALFVINQVYGCSRGRWRRRRRFGQRRRRGGFSRDAGFDVPADVSAADAGRAAMDARLRRPARRARQTPTRADAVVAGRGVHLRRADAQPVPAPPWNAATCNTNTPNMCPTAYLSGIFVDSDTDVACLSGYPAARANDQPSIQARAQDQGNRRPRRWLAAAGDSRQRPPRRRHGRARRHDRGRRAASRSPRGRRIRPRRRARGSTATATGGRSSSARASSASVSSPPTAASAPTTATWTGPLLAARRGASRPPPPRTSSSSSITRAGRRAWPRTTRSTRPTPRRAGSIG